ncbi:hypothetical protein DPX16_20262 [Anabarilius grahami]|uniref:Uncharacterized protein n=1 Tax=Anabarilius grahami TaxID=495550 RepID=A0A3N0XEE1_ANAGA|nr:hypothetical protein DPX16_20262 [Anabarilius grahami]
MEESQVSLIEVQPLQPLTQLSMLRSIGRPPDVDNQARLPVQLSVSQPDDSIILWEQQLFREESVIFNGGMALRPFAKQGLFVLNRREEGKKLTVERWDLQLGVKCKGPTLTAEFSPDEWRLGEEPETSALEGGQRGAVETGHRRHEWLDCRGVADPTASHPCTGTKDTSLESSVTFRANIAQSS